MVQKTGSPKRGRPRAYDEDEALSKAMDTFWRAGYSATSLDHLTAAMNMNRPSLYGAFGDKHALYLKAVDLYIELTAAGVRRVLGEDRPFAESLRALYESALSFYLPVEGPARGCFLLGTAATESVLDAEIREKLRGSLHAFNRAIEARMKLAQSQGDLAASADPAVLAQVAGAVLHSIAVRSRAGDSRESLQTLIDAGVQLICGSDPPSARKARSKRRKRQSS
jgi:AcrR family transcriptional regulator